MPYDPIVLKIGFVGSGSPAPVYDTAYIASAAGSYLLDSAPDASSAPTNGFFETGMASALYLAYPENWGDPEVLFQSSEYDRSFWEAPGSDCCNVCPDPADGELMHSGANCQCLGCALPTWPGAFNAEWNLWHVDPTVGSNEWRGNLVGVSSVYDPANYSRGNSVVLDGVTVIEQSYLDGLLTH